MRTPHRHLMSSHFPFSHADQSPIGNFYLEGGLGTKPCGRSHPPTKTGASSMSRLSGLSQQCTVCQVLKGTGWCSPEILTGYVTARRAGVLLIETEIFGIPIMITSIISLLYDGGIKMQLFSREEARFSSHLSCPDHDSG